MYEDRAVGHKVAECRPYECAYPGMLQTLFCCKLRHRDVYAFVLIYGVLAVHCVVEGNEHRGLKVSLRMEH
jgi:hypothetical protein